MLKFLKLVLTVVLVKFAPVVEQDRPVEESMLYDAVTGMVIGSLDEEEAQIFSTVMGIEQADVVQFVEKTVEEGVKASSDKIGEYAYEFLEHYGYGFLLDPAARDAYVKFKAAQGLGEYNLEFLLSEEETVKKVEQTIVNILNENHLGVLLLDEEGKDQWVKSHVVQALQIFGYDFLLDKEAAKAWVEAQILDAKQVVATAMGEENYKLYKEVKKDVCDSIYNLNVLRLVLEGKATAEQKEYVEKVLAQVKDYLVKEGKVVSPYVEEFVKEICDRVANEFAKPIYADIYSEIKSIANRFYEAGKAACVYADGKVVRVNEILKALSEEVINFAYSRSNGVVIYVGERLKEKVELGIDSVEELLNGTIGDTVKHIIDKVVGEYYEDAQAIEDYLTSSGLREQIEDSIWHAFFR